MSAKAAFGKLRESITQTEYLQRKNSKQVYCTTPSYCAKALKVRSYDTLYKFNNGLYETSLAKCPNVIPSNKGNLAIGLVSAMNVNGTCELIQQPLCDVNDCVKCDKTTYPTPMQVNTTTGAWTTKPFYQVDYIDPVGSLYGKTPCGALNWTHYLVYKPTGN